MPRKPVLVDLDADLWQSAKARAAVLGVTVSAFTEQAVADRLIATETLAQRAATSSRQYVATVARGESCSTKRRR